MEAPAATAPVAEETCQEDAFLPSEDLNKMAAAETPALINLAGWLEQARESLKRGGKPRPRLLRMRALGLASGKLQHGRSKGLDRPFKIKG